MMMMVVVMVMPSHLYHEGYFADWFIQGRQIIVLSEGARDEWQAPIGCGSGVRGGSS